MRVRLLPEALRNVTAARERIRKARVHPADGGMLDVVGFDTATPQLIADFARGTL